MNSLGKPITQRQLRVGEMIKQALGMLFIRDEAKLPNISRISAVPIIFSSTSGVNNPDILFFIKSKTS